MLPSLLLKKPRGQVAGALMALVGHWKPRAQAWQVPERVALAKVPGLQGLQAPLPEGEKKPALQARQVEAWAPEKVPAGQVLQLLEPRVLAYWPGGQTPHESWAISGLKVPTGQAVKTTAAVLLTKVPAGAARHPTRSPPVEV